MFEIDENNLPFVRTCQALLILDLQDEFISKGGILPVEHPPDFLDRTVKLLPEFRACGNIIWIRTVYDASRPVNEPHGDCENVITDNELDPKDRGGDALPRTRIRPSQRLIEQVQKKAEANGIDLASSTVLQEKGEKMEVEETYLTLRPNQVPRAVLPSSTGTNFSEAAMMGIDRKKDLVFQKSWYSAFKDGSLVQILRAKFVTEIYICGALTNISVFATAIDAARHGYAITIVEDCLGYRSKARHDEALRRLEESTGCDIVSSEQLIENLHQKAKRYQTPPRRSQYRRPQAQPKAKASSSTSIEKLMASLNLRPDGSTAPGQKALSTGPPDHVAAREAGANSESYSIPETTEARESLATKTPNVDDGNTRERVKTKIKTRRRHSKSVPKETGEGSSTDKVGASPTSGTLLAATQAPEKLQHSLSEQEHAVSTAKSPPPEKICLEEPTAQAGALETRRIPPIMASAAKGGVVKEAGPSSYCEGDTTLIRNILDEDIAEGIFEKLRDEVRWQKMSHQGGDVPRLVAVQGEVGNDGSIPIYRHPADESPPLLPFSPTVSAVRTQVEKALGHAVNHVLIQFYRDGNDHITEHSDKTLDIVRKTFICNVSLGAQRTMTFRTKKPPKCTEKAAAEAGQPRLTQRVPLPHNSLCKVGLVTNMRWLHAIRPDKRMGWEKSSEELAYNCGRISLTFRLIGTFLDKDQTKIWGQGAVAKSKEKARATINGDAAESERMIRAFSKENSLAEFDWEANYGAGFDVLHISNWPKLFLSGDIVADLRVKIMLTEYGISWTEGTLSSTFNWKDGSSSKDAPPVPEPLPVKFVDNDASQATVVGDLAIMLYLDAVYGSKRKNPPASKSQIDLARQFTRLQQSGELLKKGRVVPFSIKPFRREMEFWEAFATEGPFIAGSDISLADFAFWPVLEEIRREWKDIEGLDNLGIYYDRMRDRDSVVKVLGLREDKVEAGNA